MKIWPLKFKPSGSLGRCLCRGSVHIFWFHCVFVEYIFGSCFVVGFLESFRFTVLPAKSDSGVVFVYNFIKDLESIDHLCINPIHRIG